MLAQEMPLGRWLHAKNFRRLASIDVYIQTPRNMASSPGENYIFENVYLFRPLVLRRGTGKDGDGWEDAETVESGERDDDEGI